MFSLKALGATVLSFGLLITATSLPAAAAVALSLSKTTFATSEASPAGMTAELTDLTAATQMYTIDVGPASSTWSNINTCTATAQTIDQCGISSIEVIHNNVATASTGWTGFKMSGTSKLRLNRSGDLSYVAGDSIRITFAAGAFVAPANAEGTTFSFTTLRMGGAQVDTGSVSLTAGTPTYTVTFSANGGTGTMTAQTGSTATALTANSFTRSGYTFAGWAISQPNANAGIVDYADGASFPFTISRTLRAVWVANSSGGGSGSSSSDTQTLANTGIDSTNGIMFLLGGLSLALIGAEMIMIARRKRTN